MIHALVPIGIALLCVFLPVPVFFPILGMVLAVYAFMLGRQKRKNTGMIVIIAALGFAVNSIFAAVGLTQIFTTSSHSQQQVQEEAKPLPK